MQHIVGSMLRLTTLGATDLRSRLGKPMREVLAQPKRFALLIYLAVEGKRGPVPRDRLLAMFWPESDTEHARNTLSQALHHLRLALGPGVIESQGVHAIGVDGEKLWCDAVVFADALTRGEAELALDLYRGEFCPTLFVSGAPEVEEWLDDQRRHLRRQALAAARTLAERQLGSGDADGAARTARGALAMRPDDEADMRALLALLEQAGDGAGALLAFQDYAKRLASELETEPAVETKQLAEAIRRRREVPAGTRPAQADVVPPDGHAAGIAPSPAMPRRRDRRTLGLAAAALLLMMLGTAVVRSRAGRATPSPARAVAVFPFSVRGGAAQAYLREGMVDLLSAKLSGAAGVRALDPRAVIGAAGSADASDRAGSIRVARRLGARWLITGDVVEVAGRLQVNGALYAVDGAPQALATMTVTGDTSTLFQLVDDLAGRMLAELAGGRDTALTRLAALTTHSLPALKAFLQGEQALRAGRDAQAGAAFREAALLDTTFALAQYRLALTSNWVSIPGVAPQEWARRAARHSQRLTPMVRDLLTAYQAYKDVRWTEAERTYRALTAAYPDHVEAWLMLGETYFHYNWLHGEPPAEAWAPLERVLALDPGNVHALIHLARLAALEGRTALLDSLVEGFVTRYGDAERSLELRALRAFAQGDRAGRATIAREIRGADELVAYSALEAAFVYAQNLDAALELAPRFDPAGAATESWPSVSTQGRRLLLSVGPAAGRWDRQSIRWSEVPADARDWLFETKVLIAVEPSLSVSRARLAALRDSLRARRPYPVLKSLTYPSPSGLAGADMQRYLDGLLSIRLGDRAEAERDASELGSGGGDSTGHTRAMLGVALRAEIAQAAGDHRRALAELDRFDLAPTEWVKLPSHWGTRARFLRAEVLTALGRDGEAADLYDSIHSSLDAPYIALAHLRRAQIHARHGEPDQARFHYGRFLRWWEDADPEFQPLVVQARRELAALGPAPR